ncbi:MAG TPA: SBBP repeat-containing protein [Polyangia bacterium]
MVVAVFALGLGAATAAATPCPHVSWGSFLGGSRLEVGAAVAIDGGGHAFVAGTTASSDFPAAGGPAATLAGASDAFVAKVDLASGALVWATHLGGAGRDAAHALVVDGAGDVYVAGWTDSADFPASGGFQPARAGTADAFVARLHGVDGALVWASYLGGTGDEAVVALAADATGVYLTGGTDSRDFPVTGGFQAVSGGNTDAFVVKVDPTGASLVWSTYLGGAGYERGQAIVVDGAGTVYVAGVTSSTDLPAAAGPQPVFGGGFDDAFVAKIAAAGSSLVWASYLGGSAREEATALAVDGAGMVYVAGGTSSADFPLQGAAQPAYGGEAGDSFVAALDPTGASLSWSTFLGGGGLDGAAAVALDGGGGLLVAGFTSSTDLPGLGVCSGTLVGGNYLARLGTGSGALEWSASVGGGATLRGLVAAGADCYVAGDTAANDLPVPGGFQTASAGGQDAFLLRLSPPLGLGAACTRPASCASGFCVDEVCCDTACGADNPTDCQACSVAAGAAADGTCGLVACPPAAACHGAGTCDPGTRLCASSPLPDGTACSGGQCASGACVPNGDAGAAQEDAGAAPADAAPGDGAAPDAAVSPVDAGAGETDAAAPDATAPPAGATPSCGCRLGATQRSLPPGLVVLSALMCLRRRRRRSAALRALLLLGLLALAPAAASAASTILSWDAVPVPVLGYKLYYGLQPGTYDGTQANEGPSPVNVPLSSLADPAFPSVELTGLPSCTRFYFAVTAYDGSAESGYSNEVNKVVVAVPGSLTVTPGAPGTLLVRWSGLPFDDLGTLYAYRVNYDMFSGQPYLGTGAAEGDSPITVLVATLADPTAPALLLTGLPGGQFFFAVEALCADGSASKLSAEASGTAVWSGPDGGTAPDDGAPLDGGAANDGGGPADAAAVDGPRADSGGITPTDAVGRDATGASDAGSHGSNDMVTGGCTCRATPAASLDATGLLLVALVLGARRSSRREMRRPGAAAHQTDVPRRPCKHGGRPEAEGGGSHDRLAPLPDPATLPHRRPRACRVRRP